MTSRLRLAAQALLPLMDNKREVDEIDDCGWSREEVAALDALRRALAEPAPCPDGVENCPGDCTGERPATVPHYDTLEIAQPCPRCNGDRVVMRDKDRRTVEVVPCPRCGT